MRRMGISFRSALFVVTLMFVTAVAVRAVSTTVAPVTEDDAVQAATQKPAAPAAAAAATGDALVLRGRYLVISHACGECHGGGNDPSAKGFLAGLGASEPPVDFKIGPPPCGIDPAAKGCFTTRPRNLTPDDTGMGKFTERQLFNALRYGLRPE